MSRRSALRVTAVALGLLATAAVVAPIGPGAAPASAANTPGAPTAVPGDGFVEVSWPFVPTQSAIDRFRITRYDGSSTSPAATIETGGTSVRRRIYDLDPAKTYRFTVAAHDESGWGSASAKTAAAGPADLWPFITADELSAQQSIDLRARPITSAETAAARTALGGNTSAAAYVVDVSHSADAKPLAAMARLYLAYFKRPPDPSGYGYWVGKLRAGTKIELASSTFAGSSEFKRTYGSVSNKAFVQLVYENVLGRSPDRAGLSYWTGQLDARKRTRGAVMTQFSESSENLRKKVEEVDAIVLRYGLLRTTPSVAQFQDAVTRMEAGTPAVTIAQELFGSEAYRTRFGRQAGAPVQAPKTSKIFNLGSAMFSSGLIDPSGRYAYGLAGGATNDVVAVDLLAGKVRGTFPVNRDSRLLALSPDGTRLYFSGEDPRVIEVVDALTLVPLDPIEFAAPEYPTGLVPLADGSVVFALYDGNATDVLRLDPATGERSVYAEDLRDPELAATADRSHIGVYFESGWFQMVDLATDDVAAKRYIGQSFARFQGWGNDGFALGATLYDVEGNLISVLPDTREVLGIDPTGHRAYRTSGNQLEVLDLDRGIVNQRLPLPKTSGISAYDVAVDGDGRTIMLPTNLGMVVAGAPTALAAEPVATERAPFSPFIPTAGANDTIKVSDVKVAPDSATVWAVNQGLNQVEVFDATTRDRLKLIKLSYVPNSLDFSPDGTKAYVVGPGSSLVTVIDTATRSVHHQFALPASSSWFEVPQRVAATADGRLLVSRGTSPYNSETAVTLIDLTTEKEVPGAIRPTQQTAMRFAPSGDRTKVLIPVASNGSSARWYDTAAGAFTALTNVATQTFSYGPAVDQDGDRIFGGRRVLDGSFSILGAINTPQPLTYLAGISPDGSTGYRVETNTLRVLDLEGYTSLRGVSTGDLGEKDDANEGAIAVSPNGHVVAVITSGGLSILQDP